MKLVFGTNVYGRDGEQVGVIKEVVVDPATREVSHLVVQRGLLFQDDRLVDMDLVEGTTTEGVRLSRTSAELEGITGEYRQDEYVESARAETQSEDLPEKLWARPPTTGSSVVPPGITPGDLPPDVSIPANDVGLLHGSKVVGKEGKAFGKVKALLTDADDKLSHIVVSEGLVFPRPKMVPIDWIASFEENTVVLATNSTEVDQLPDAAE